MARGRSRGRRSDYTWNGAAWFDATLSATQSLGSGSIATVNAAGTLVRLRGYATVSMDVAAADNTQVVALGMIVGSDDQVAAGATAFPSPMDDLDADWIWHSFFPLRSVTGTQSDGVGGQVVSQVIDSKAMRRVKQNDQLVMVADAQILAGSPTADSVAGVRALFAT